MQRAEFIRPSSLQAIEACPGRPLMEARACAAVPLLATMERAVAMQGTMGHEVIAQTLALIYLGQARTDPAAALARMAGAMDGLQTWTQDGVRRCVAYVVALMTAEEERGSRPRLFVEFHLSGKGINIARGGTADVVIVCDDRIIVEDAKLGFLNQGDAADHLQLGGYACMAYDRFRIPDVHIHLAQGRIRDFSAARFGLAAIAATRARILAAVAAAEAAEPELRPGIDACRYCRCLTVCRAAREHIMHAAQESAMFGMEAIDRLKLAEDAKLAARFAEEAKATAKAMVAENAQKEARGRLGAEAIAMGGQPE